MLVVVQVEGIRRMGLGGGLDKVIEKTGDGDGADAAEMMYYIGRLLIFV